MNSLNSGMCRAVIQEPQSLNSEQWTRMCEADSKTACRGVICLLKVVDGEVVKGDRITTASNGEHYDILEVRSLCSKNSGTWLAAC